MRNILKISAAFLMLLTVGCTKNYLNPVPKTSLSDLSVFDNADRIMAQVNAMYSATKAGTYLGGRYIAIGDLRGDNWVPESNNVFTLFATWQQQVLSGSQDARDTWGAIYAAINVINVFMDGLKTNWESGKLANIITQAEYDQYTSEALTLRAMCYYDLIRLYAKPYVMNNGANPGVPLRLKAEKSAGGNDLALSPVADVYTQILSDLDAAEPLAISTYNDDYLNTTRIHKNTVIAFKVRVLLSKGDWAGVVTESAKLVSSSAPFVAPAGVPNTLDSDWMSIWSGQDTKESIFSLPNTATNNGGLQSAITWYFNSTSPESFYLVTTSPVYAAMDATDIRRSSMVQVAPEGGTGPDLYFISKYTDLVGLSDWCPILRYAEILLSRAEAIVRSGSAVTQEAVDLLNAVRTRAYPAGAYTVASFASPADFYTAVLQERDFEFLGEGMRAFDLLRLGMDIPQKDGLTQGIVQTIPSSSSIYVWPIPDSETSMNKLAH